MKSINTQAKAIAQGIKKLNTHDKSKLLDKIEDARWKSGPTYNEGIHILMNVIEDIIKSSK